MTNIKTGLRAPGIIELVFYKSSTGKALSNLAHTLLLGPSPLSPGEREMIAAYISHLNDCEFCHHSHCAAAAAHLDDNGETMKAILGDPDLVPFYEKFNRLLNIAFKVQIGGKAELPADIETAKQAGATDEEIHDTVLITAAFCMFNRYVDGLGTIPAAKHEYAEMGRRMKKGYKLPPPLFRKFIVWKMNSKSS